MFKFIKIAGDSMSPVFNHGDYVLISSIFSFLYKEGRSIVFHSPEYGLMIKQISRVLPEKAGFRVQGISPASIGEEEIGPVSRRDVLGAVVLHFRRKE